MKKTCHSFHYKYQVSHIFFLQSCIRLKRDKIKLNLKKMRIIILFLLISCASGIHIECGFVGAGYQILSAYACYITSIDYSSNSTHILSYGGTHWTGRSNLDVESISARHYICPELNLQSIPKGVLSIFPNLKVISFNNCSINFLNGDELKEYPNLVIYEHYSTNITRIPGNFFSFTPNLLSVTFRSNKQLKHVGVGLLDGLIYLKSVTFYANGCIDKNTVNGSQILDLSQELKVKCPDIVMTTTTSLTTTTIQPRCEIEEPETFVCVLDEEIENLKTKVENLTLENQNLKINSTKLQADVSEVQKINEGVSVKIEELTLSKDDLTNTVEVLKKANEEIKSAFESNLIETLKFKNAMKELLIRTLELL